MTQPDTLLGKSGATPDEAAAAASAMSADPTGDPDAGGMAAIKEYVRLAKAVAQRKKDDAADKARMAQLEAPIISWMIDNDMQNTTVLGMTAYLNSFTGAAKLDPDMEPEAIVAAAKAAGLDHLAKESVNWQTLGAYVREEIEAGRDLHPELAKVIRITTTTKLGVRT